jgi:hypothetical protein
VENMMNRLSDLSGKETGKIRATSVPAKPRTPNPRLYARIHAISLPDSTTAPPPQSDKLRASSNKNCHRTRKQLLPSIALNRPHASAHDMRMRSSAGHCGSPRRESGFLRGRRANPFVASWTKIL